MQPGPPVPGSSDRHDHRGFNRGPDGGAQCRAGSTSLDRPPESHRGGDHFQAPEVPEAARGVCGTPICDRPPGAVQPRSRLSALVGLVRQELEGIRRPEAAGGCGCGVPARVVLSRVRSSRFTRMQVYSQTSPRSPMAFRWLGTAKPNSAKLWQAKAQSPRCRHPAFFRTSTENFRCRTFPEPVLVALAQVIFS